MKYFLDTEFIDHEKQPKLLGFRVGKPIQTTELISIGIVSEDGREYYAVCNEFDLDAAWKDTWVRCHVLEKIHDELVKAQGPHARTHHHHLFEPFTKKSMRYLLKWSGKSRYQIRHEINEFVNEEPEFYGYYADYDWVVFCHLFGRMIDLPSGFPMYCMDLMQVMKERGLDSKWKDERCPDPVDEHRAIVDARWNMSLYKALHDL